MGDEDPEGEGGDLDEEGEGGDVSVEDEGGNLNEENEGGRGVDLDEDDEGGDLQGVKRKPCNKLRGSLANDEGDYRAVTVASHKNGKMSVHCCWEPQEQVSGTDFAFIVVFVSGEGHVYTACTECDAKGCNLQHMTNPEMCVQACCRY